MMQKKITIVMSYDYDEHLTKSNSMIAWNIERDLRHNLNPAHERIDTVIVEDIDREQVFDTEVTMKDLDQAVRSGQEQEPVLNESKKETMDNKLSYMELVRIRLALKSTVEDYKEILGPESILLPEYEIILEKIEDILLKY